MGVYIDGMGMPKSCYYCPMTNDGFYLCKATSPFKELEDDCEECRPEWCPIVPVPEHGDLIDRDAMIADIQKNVAPTQYIKDRNSNMIYFLRHREAIIPAEDDADRMSNCIHLYCKQGADAIERLNAFNLMWQEAVKINEQAEKEEA